MALSDRHTACDASLLALITALLLFTAASCRNNDKGNAVWGTQVEASVSPDSIRLADGTALNALSDTCLLVTRPDGTTFTLTASDIPEGRMQLSSPSPLLDLMLRLEQRHDYPGGYSYLTPLELYLDPLPAKESAKILKSKIKNGYVVPAETRRYLWPAINNNALWLLAATELAKLDNDPRWIAQVTETARNITRLDRTVSYNHSTGLIGGMPRYMLHAEPMLPQWLGACELFTSASLTVNVAYAAALKNLNLLANDYARRNDRLSLPEMGFDPDSLSRAIHRNMWLPAQGIFSGLFYGSGCSYIQLHSADNIGQSIAVISGIANPAIRSSIMASTPTGPSGTGLFAPATGLGEVPLPTPLNMMLRTMWAVAASRVPDAADRYDMAVRNLLSTAASSYAAGDEKSAVSGRPIESLILRGILGAAFHLDGTSFTPSVPAGLPGTLIVRNLCIRRAKLNVIVRGTGSVITACSLDGAPSEPFIPASAEGEHTLEIALAPYEGTEPTPRKGAHSLSVAPEMLWSSPLQAELSAPQFQNEKTTFFAYINGVLSDQFDNPDYHVAESRSPQWVQFACAEKGEAPGLATPPHAILPKEALTIIHLSTVAKGGTRIINDRKVAERFVESNRWKNRTLRFDVDVNKEGDYLIDMHYIHGLGIVNARRRVALRRLEVNSEPCGIMVFPQLSKAVGAENAGWKEWQTLSSYTNPLKASLKKGHNIIEIRFWQPSPVFVGPDANVILADHLRLIRL